MKPRFGAAICRVVKHVSVRVEIRAMGLYGL